ncbi:MAG: endolytic transglycosylase MltG [Candidatus Magasanikbacteria bacterium CG10_big_fil_rev_8_21_14_0_10_36_32]|uniref:Endolytic murein transglycosylase n=1 Tax=Candidatus Magasanikbacteria bacterium CG10_big_fil_rev_8_21_14_0_10_36_32 TaxID=1974646 RepID=A0A2M6W6F4_9BACT|nr:MAG: endolytic transglycosylase MltG [Candidatus Magasanikbacteria bacterium CG10_big_fil_rev_8_21_14_0_10_36_32]
MSVNQKISIISLVILLAFPAAGYFYYKKTHPKYIPIPRPEINIRIKEGWNLRQIADDWKNKGIVSSTENIYNLLGQPAYNYEMQGKTAPVLALANDSRWAEIFFDKPDDSSYEGYLFPDTYTIYQDSDLNEILEKIFENLESKITIEMRAEIKKQGKTIFEILNMASIVEKEAPDEKNMAMVADIFWRRLDEGMALQSCATVNYVTGKSLPAVSAADKAIDSQYNTYKYRGLPPGPISNPSLTAIKATIYPEKNNYVYFMSGSDGVIHYAKTLEEHNINVYKYLK